MARPLRKTESVLMLPAQISDHSAGMFIRDLKERLTDSASEQTIIDCSNIPQLSAPQIALLDRVAGLCKNASIRLVLRPGQTGLTDSVKEICKDNYDASSKKDQSSDHRAVGEKQVCNSAKEYNDEFHPTSSELNTAGNKLNDYMLALECDLKTCYVIKTIFYEFVNNILSHSGMKEEDKISFSMTISKAAVKMTFIDGGRRFDINKVPHGPYVSAVFEEERLSFGILLIRTLSDKIEYMRSKEAKNITTIIYGRHEK